MTRMEWAIVVGTLLLLLALIALNQSGVGVPWLK